MSNFNGAMKKVTAHSGWLVESASNPAIGLAFPVNIQL